MRFLQLRRFAVAFLTLAVLAGVIRLGMLDIDFESAHTVTVQIDIREEPLRQEVLKALATWDKVSQIDFKIVKAKGKLRIETWNLKGTTVGTFRGKARSHGIIQLHTIYAEGGQGAYHTILHELGHFLLGPGHVDTQESIMYAFTDAKLAAAYGNELSEYDIKWIKRLEGKDVEGFPVESDAKLCTGRH